MRKIITPHSIWSPLPYVSRRDRAAHSILLVVSALMVAFTSGCGGGLSPEETERYNLAEAELAKLRQDQNALERRVKQDFNESGKLERSRKLKGTVSASCRQQLANQRFGPLPFRKRKGKSAHLKSGSGRVPSGCTPHKINVR